MTESESIADELPLAGLRVIEFTHMVMGPAVGLILGDLGADVIKIEPISGDKTRKLVGSGAGYFPMYNRNKRSICIDMKARAGKAIARRLVASADVVIENFRPGAMEKLGFGYDDLAADNPRLIYCSEKGFLSGPYEHRTALDEVAQMMGGLAYMTGPPGQPLRAGSSVIDVVGGMFGVIGILAALEERRRTGRGQQVKSSLFESTVFLVGQHMAQYAVTGEPAQPMPVRISAWAIYDVFETGDGQQVFVGVVSDTQWEKFCAAFDVGELAQDPTLKTNVERVKQRDRILPIVRALFKGFSKSELMERLEHTGLPFAPITRPEDLFDDPHVNADSGLVDLNIPGDSKTKLPALPLEMAGHRFAARRDLPGPGQQTREILQEAGLDDHEIDALMADNTVA